MVAPRRIWLLAPLWLLFSADVAFTLWGQPADYWAGNRSMALEANPLAREFLADCPRSFAAAAAVWIVGLSAVLLLWRSRWAGRLAMVAAFVHALGGSSWLSREGPQGWAMAIAYLVLAAEFSWFCWRRADPRSFDDL